MSGGDGNAVLTDNRAIKEGAGYRMPIVAVGAEKGNNLRATQGNVERTRRIKDERRSPKGRMPA
jgi:hypothetical protein